MSPIAVELGTAYVSILPDTSRIAPDMKKAFGGVDKEAAKAGDKAGSAFSGKFGKAMKVAGVAAGAALVAGVGLAVKGGIDSALNLDAATRSLTGLHGSAEQAADTIARVGKVSRDSSIDHADYAEAAKNLAYIGVEGSQLENILKNAGDAIVGFGGDGSNLERVNDSLSKMVNNGKVNREELLQLSDAGIPIFEGLSTHLGVTVEEMNKMVSDGVVGIEDVLSVMENGTGAYFGQLLDAGGEMEKGLGATWSRLKDNLKLDIGEAITNSGILDAMVPMMSSLGDALLSAVDNAVAFAGAMQDVGGWIRDNQAWVGPLAAAIGGAALAWGAWVGAITLWQTVTKVAAGIQAAFNAVMAANPIMLIVIAIAALVAGLVYFFTQTETGKQVWDTLVQAFATGWQWVKDAFAAAWAVIQPILSGIWDGIQFIGAIFGTILLGTVLVAWNIFSAALSLAWNTLIKPVWDAFAFVMQWLWTAVLQPIWSGMQIAFHALGAFFQWVWTALIKPAWDALGNGIKWVWETLIRPAWDALKAALAAVGAVFQSAWNSVIKPAWDALGNGIRSVWDNVISPAFEALKSGLDSVKGFFSTVVEGIRSEWDKLKGHVATPINFVIDTVWNNGLVKAWETIQRFLPGLPDAQRLTPVAFATGGAVYGPGTGTSDSIMARLSSGEHVLTAAEVKALGGQRQVYAMREMIAKGHMPMGHGLGMPAFADGGEVGGGVRLSPTPGEGGLEDIAKLAKRLIHRIWPSITSIGGYRQDAYPEHPSGRALDVMVGVGNPIGDEVTSWALANNPVLPLQHALWKQTVWTPNGATTPMGDRGNPTENHMDHPHLWYRPKAIDPNVIPDGLVGHDGLSREDRLGVIKEKINEIIDKMMDPLIEGMTGVIGTPPPEWLGIMPKVADKSKDGAIDAAFDFVENIGDDLKDAYSAAKDVKDIVVSSISGLWRDNGGFIPTGKSVVTNETGKPEAVLNWEQLQQIVRLMESAGGLAAIHRWSMGDTEAARRHGVDQSTIDSIGQMSLQFAEHMAEVLQTAQSSFVSSARSDVLDFFGLSGLAGGIQEVWDTFHPTQGATSTASGAAAGAVSTSKVPVTGDYQLEPHTVELETTMPDFDAGGSPGSGPIKDQVKEAMASSGWDSGAQWGAVDFIVQNESSWNPNAQNPNTTAYGLFQFLDSTWGAYGHTKTDNPKLQGEAGETYIKRRYGDPLGAERFWRANRWYDNGGWMNTGLSLVRNSTGKPEPVLNPSQWADISRQSHAVADLVDGQGSRRGAPLVVIENLQARDEDEAMRSAMREARRASRSNSMIGGW